MIRQAGEAVLLKPKPELVVIQGMDNDIRCDGTDEQNYPTFRAMFVKVLTVLARGLPNARIFVVSQFGRPRTYAEAIKDIPQPRALQTGDGPCDLFDASGRINSEHVATLEGIIETYEANTAAACSRFVDCRFDGGALAQPVDELADLSSVDWGHLSVHGHAKLAALAWPAMFDFTDQVPPVSTATQRKTHGGKASSP